MGWIKNKISAIANIFVKQLPDEGGKASTSDDALVIKTSPTVWEYEMFRLEWDRRSILRDIELMLKSDPRIKRANHVFASTAVRKGITVTVTSQVDSSTADKAQKVINKLMRDCQINAKLLSWARILLKDGDLFLNLVVDLNERSIKNIKRLPAITMQRNDDMTGNFPDINKAFRQIDPISLQTISEFPLWSINHIRYDHEEGDRYGTSQYLTCRGYWKKLNMTEEDLVVRRRTRAPARRLHNVGNKDNPGDWNEVEKYKSENQLDPRKAQITTDYYGNGLVDIKDLSGDADLDKIKDIEHIQEVYMLGTGVPLHILGFGQGVNRDVVGDQLKQFKEDTQELQSLLEYGDSSPYSGLRPIFDFALALAGINPEFVDYNVEWFESDNETANDRVDRVTKLRNTKAMPDPLISKKLALTIVSKDLGLENQAAIEAELKELDKEKENTSPKKADIKEQDIEDSTESDGKKKEYFFPLHGKRMAQLEKKFTGEIIKNYNEFYEKIQPDVKKFISKIGTLRSIYKDSNILVDQLLELFQKSWQKNDENMIKSFEDIYLLAAEYAKDNAAKDVKKKKAITDSSSFLNPNVEYYFKNQASERMKSIDYTTKKYLRDELYDAYENNETPEEWESRIKKVLDCDAPKGRAEMIARTELAWAYNKGLVEAHKELGTHKVRWLSVIDNKTCNDCRENDGQVFDIDNLPDIPLHPRCRCTIVSADDD